MCTKFDDSFIILYSDFFKNIVRPLFELWNVFLDSKLTRQLINNLNFNEYMWKNMENVKQSRIKHSHSLISFSDKFEIESTIRCKSYNKLSPLNLSSITLFENTLTKLKASQTVEKSSKPECINGCGTPPSSKEIIMATTNSEEKVKLNDDVDFDDEEDDFISEFNCGAILSTPALILPNFCYEKVNFYCFILMILEFFSDFFLQDNILEEKFINYHYHYFFYSPRADSIDVVRHLVVLT